eukprot:168928_1
MRLSSNEKRREPSGGFDLTDNNSSVAKRRKTIDQQLQAKLECLNLIGTTVENKSNINQLNVNNIKQYLTSEILTQNQKTEILNEYYFVIQPSQIVENVENEETEFEPLSAICEYYCRNTRNQNDAYSLWIQLVSIFIENGMNPFLQRDAFVYLNKYFVFPYIDKKTIKIKSISTYSERSNLNYLADCGHYSIVINAINKYLNNIPPIISIEIPNNEWLHYFQHFGSPFDIDLIMYGSIIGQSFGQFSQCGINKFNFSPDSLKLSLQNLKSLVIDITHINKFDRAIASVYDSKIKNIQSNNEPTRIAEEYNYTNESILVYLFLIKCFYKHYKKNILAQLKNVENILPPDIIN